MVNTIDPQVDPGVSNFDADELMVPPWIKFPSLPKASMRWWTDRGRACEAFRNEFGMWWGRQAQATRLKVRERYPEPPEWEQFYSVMSITAGQDPEIRRIHELMGALSDAFWRSLGKPGVSAFEKMCRNAQNYQAESAEEIAIWIELTAPHNYPAVVRYVDLHKGQVYAGGLLEEAQHRWETEGTPVNTA